MWLSYNEIGYVVASIEEIRYLTKDSTDFSMAIRNFTMFTMFTKVNVANIFTKLLFKWQISSKFNKFPNKNTSELQKFLARAEFLRLDWTIEYIWACIQKL